MIQYPITQNRALVQPDQIATFIDMLFGYAESDDGCIMIRGVNEKDTPQKQFAKNVAIDPRNQNVAEVITGWALHWAERHIATYVVPAVMSWETMEDGKGTEDRVVLFTALCTDIDGGDTDAKLAWIRSMVGQPTMVVSSGGHNDVGQLKYHVWHRFNEVTDDIKRVAALRLAIAQKAGCDHSFGRAAQIIRMPGTVWAKGGEARTCSILEYNPQAVVSL